jgi:hypothetical protein
MKRLLIVSAMLLMVGTAKAQQDPGLPELHKIKTVSLSPSYSCRSKEDFQKGYENTALFLSSFSKRFNSPDLLFNGACGSDDYFQASTAGDDMALVADLDDASLEDISAHLAFNTSNVFAFKKFTRFVTAARVKVGHTYAVLLNKGELRGLFIFTVTDYVPNQRVDLKYAVKQYQLINRKAESPGFDWNKKSQND